MLLDPLPFSLRQLQYVLAVAETGGFRKAAARCAVSQPALSAQVALVEEAVGVLFERDARSVHLTPLGEHILPILRALLIQASDLALQAQGAARHLPRPLRAGVIPTIAPFFLPRLARHALQSPLTVRLHWSELQTHTLLKELQEGALDFGILARVPEVEGWTTLDLGFDPFLLALPIGHPLSKKRSAIRLESLHDVPLMLLDEGHCLRDQALSLCARAGVQAEDLRATSLSTLIHMVSAGLGVTLLPRMASESESVRHHLVLRTLGAPAPGRDLVLAWRPTSPLGPLFRHLAVTFRQCLKPASRKDAGNLASMG